MRIVFYGGEKAGAIVLLSLKASKNKIVQVFAQDEFVFNIAKLLKLNVLPVNRLNKKNVLPCDLLVCCHGKKVLKEELLVPLLGGINLHPFLKDFKGANPVGRWLEEKNCGLLFVGVHWMSTQVDCGEIVCIQSEKSNAPYSSVQQVYEELYALYSGAIVSALNLVEVEAKFRQFQTIKKYYD